MRLFENPASGNCYKVKLLLGHLGLEYESIRVELVPKEERPADLLQHTPMGTVPVLELDDGRALLESDAILWYLAEGTPYLPEDSYARARVLAWMFFEQNAHEPNIAVARNWIKLKGTPEAFPGNLEYRLASGAKALSIMEAHLATNDFLAAGTYTIADIALFGYTHVAGDAGYDLSEYPAVQDWIERVKSQPGYVDM
jgi:glutathione S-transferase